MPFCSDGLLNFVANYDAALYKPIYMRFTLAGLVAGHNATIFEQSSCNEKKY